MNCKWCGHDEDAHDHYRPGTDCGRCGKKGCPGFVRTMAGYYLLKWTRRWWS